MHLNPEPLPVAYTSKDTTVRPPRPAKMQGKRCVALCMWVISVCISIHQLMEYAYVCVYIHPPTNPYIPIFRTNQPTHCNKIIGARPCGGLTRRYWRTSTNSTRTGPSVRLRGFLCVIWCV
jgi:hypothetical protein